MAFPATTCPRAVAQKLSRYDASGSLTDARLRDIGERFALAGAIHVVNTGFENAGDILPALADLGFPAQEQFSAGGRTSAVWQDKWAAPGLRRMDHYPPHLRLLPNTEVQYQRCFPMRVLFFCTIPPIDGGQTFLHAAKAVEECLRADPAGERLLGKIESEGLTIETGFLDESHPEKPFNYFQSWQERFGTHDRDAALKAAMALSDEYDECWWREDGGYPVLMTRITLPGFVTHPVEGGKYLRFPRIAMDGPASRNGFRRFPLGSGEEMTPAELALVRDAYASTGEGHAWSRGDVILIDNIRFGHSRAPFEGPREVLVGMAGPARIEKFSGEISKLQIKE